MRLDRFITLNLVQPCRRAFTAPKRSDGGSSLVTPLPILMYHSISDDPEAGVRPYYRICTGPQRFREQMQWLKDNGYRGVTLSDGLAALGSANQKQKIENRNPKSEIANQQCPPSGLRPPTSDLRPVVMTFDDGFRDFHTAAWPILREFGFTATMYLPTAFIGSALPTPSPRRGLETLGKRRKEFAGGEGPLRAERAGASESLGRGEVTNPSSCHVSPVTRHAFHGKECLTWAEAKELHRTGIEFGSHTVHHPELVNLAWPEIESEIRDSKSEIENRLGVPCATFAYPYAFPQTRRDFVDRFKDLLMTGGYETCVTTQIGRHRPGDDALQIKRLPVNQDDDPPLLAAKLAGAYDWLGRVQSLSKQFRRSRNTLACFADHKDQLDSLVGAPIAHGRPDAAARAVSDCERRFPRPPM